MYLKSLEVLNFKSFKGEVTVPLDLSLIHI